LEEEKSQAIVDFLMEFKDIVVNGRGLDVVPRLENKQALIELGLTAKNRYDEILSLAVSNYCEGPLEDRDRPGYVWCFGKQLNEKEVYIKLKIAIVEGIKVAKCLSFHIAKYPLIYPCRQNEEEN
jgi:hypothetical protein